MSEMLDLVDLHQKICQKLHLDDNVGDLSWDAYVNVRECYTLEGEKREWLAVAIYVTCCGSDIADNEQDKTVASEHSINLPRLLRLCNCMFLDFIAKSKLWIEMTHLPDSFKIMIDCYEHAYAVSYVTFKKFRAIFIDMYCDPYVPWAQYLEINGCDSLCTLKRLLEFSWVLFISVKMKYSDLKYDLVNSYHMLLACCDFIYANSVSSDRRDILNRSFSGLPEHFFDDDFDPPLNPICVIDHICQKHDGVTLDAKNIKIYTWRLNVKSYFERGILRGDVDRLNGALENDVFEYNYSSINKHYDYYVTTAGNFDERQFLIDNARVDPNSPTISMMNHVPVSCFGKLKKNEKITERESTGQWVPAIAKKYLQHRTNKKASTSSEVTQSIAKLQMLLTNRLPGPSKFLIAVVRSCDETLLYGIQYKINAMANTIQNYFIKTATMNNINHIEFAAQRVEYTKILYYKVLEDILFEESKIMGTQFTKLMSMDVFHRTLFACCLEIVIYSYSLQPAFLWVFGILQIHGFHFYKIIELIVRAEKQLSREIVKHLHLIEEQVLDSLSWQEMSPLWDSLECIGMLVPTCESVAVPSDDSVSQQNLPVGRFVTLSTNSKQTFDAKECQRFVSIITQKNGAEANKDSSKQKKGSLDIFFRKFYHLASVRLYDLCEQLDIHSDDTKRKIWTCFEHVILKSTHIMKNRHLDQILMCCVYVTSKTVGVGISFHEIMKAYRNQPQASPHIYRNVLLLPDSIEISAAESMMSLANACNQNGEKFECDSLKRGDLIQFYNLIFVKIIHEFIDEISTKTAADGLILSPLPTASVKPYSPVCRVSDKYPVFVRCLDKIPVVVGETIATVSFSANGSPSMDLKVVNEMIRKQYMKRENESAAKHVPKKKAARSKVVPSSRLQNLIDERLSTASTTITC